MRQTIRIDAPTDTAAVRIGERTFVPNKFTATIEVDGDHTIVLDIEVNDGRPECGAVHVLRGEGQPRLTGDELRRLPLTKWVSQASEQAAVLATVELDYADYISAEAEGEMRTDARRSVRRQVPVTAARLQEVAYTWRECDGKAPDMASMLNVSRAQVYRLIKAARTAGLIEESED